MENNSGITPKGWRILIKPLEIAEMSKGGIIISHGVMKDREEMSNTTGQVIEVGTEANTWCVSGSRIVFAKYAGLVYLGKDGVKYRIINDDDVVATLDDDVKLVDPFLAKGV
jgi:co-chaperonin GroES (HSP10)